MRHKTVAVAIYVQMSIFSNMSRNEFLVTMSSSKQNWPMTGTKRSLKHYSTILFVLGKFPGKLTPPDVLKTVKLIDSYTDEKYCLLSGGNMI